MNKKFIERAEFWDSDFSKFRLEEIKVFEEKNDIELPLEYVEFLQVFGKLKYDKVPYYYDEILISESIDLQDQEDYNEFFWNEFVLNNPSFKIDNFLPIFFTYDPNTSFLIGMNQENKGKIYLFDNTDDVAIEVADSFIDFFTNRTYTSKGIFGMSQIGTIEIEKFNGTEVWNINSGNFSIKKIEEKYRISFYIKSENDSIHKLDDTGETEVIFEIKFSVEKVPDLSNIWTYEYPSAIEVQDDFGEANEGFWDDFYYNAYESLEEIKLEILEGQDGYHYIEVFAKMKDIVDYNFVQSKCKIIAKLKMSENYEGYWL